MSGSRKNILTKEDIEEIIRLRKGTKTKKGWGYLRIAKKFDVHHTSILYWIKKANSGKSIRVYSFDGKDGNGGGRVPKYIKKGGQGEVRVPYGGKLKGAMYKDYLKEEEARKQARCGHRGMGSDARSCFLCGYVVEK